VSTGAGPQVGDTVVIDVAGANPTVRTFTRRGVHLEFIRCTLFEDSALNCYLNIYLTSLMAGLFGYWGHRSSNVRAGPLPDSFFDQGHH
jgi:hypothetical protein